MLGLIVPILCGFAMATLGVALLILGEVPFLGGKRIGAVRARMIGIVLLSFFPLTLGLQPAINAFYGSDTVDGPTLMWSLFGGCWFLVLVLLFRVMMPKKQARRAVASSNPGAAAKNAFVAPDAPAEADTSGIPWTAPQSAQQPAVKKSVPGKPGKPPAEEENPFDFG